MSASTNTVPAQMGFGRLPSALAALALVVIIAVAVAVAALGSTKAAPLAESGAKGAPPPAFIDHGSRDEMGAAKSAPILSGGGWGPAAAAGIQESLRTTGGNHSGLRLRPQ